MRLKCGDKKVFSVIFLQGGRCFTVYLLLTGISPIHLSLTMCFNLSSVSSTVFFCTGAKCGCLPNVNVLFIVFHSAVLSVAMTINQGGKLCQRDPEEEVRGEACEEIKNETEEEQSCSKTGTFGTRRGKLKYRNIKKNNVGGGF